MVIAKPMPLAAPVTITALLFEIIYVSSLTAISRRRLSGFFKDPNGAKVELDGAGRRLAQPLRCVLLEKADNAVALLVQMLWTLPGVELLCLRKQLCQLGAERRLNELELGMGIAISRTKRRMRANRSSKRA
jgi:hypothetical protein